MSVTVKIIDDKKVFDMKLHEMVVISERDGRPLMTSTKVPGGWVYGDMFGNVFVPYTPPTIDPPSFD